jgi:putative restriction endonuclease
MYTHEEQMMIRLDIFQWLELKLDEHEWVTRNELLYGYTYMGFNIPLIANQQGINNPKYFDETLSVLSTARSSYADTLTDDGMIQYDYESQSIEGYNTKLRKAYMGKVPLVYFQQIKPGIYRPNINVYVVGDDVANKRFVLDARQAGEIEFDFSQHVSSIPQTAIEKKYAMIETKRRVHQPKFRAAVMLAYSEQCSICRLQHKTLLDAAHILPDSHEFGQPVVSNGISLCKIHHAAFDKKIIGISPDFKVKVSEKILAEVDGPMLKHGIQEMHNSSLQIPKAKEDQPNRQNLEIVYQEFLISA